MKNLGTAAWIAEPTPASFIFKSVREWKALKGAQ